MVKIKCSVCGKEKEVYPSRAKSSKRHFCSRKCMSIGMSGEGNPMHGREHTDEMKNHMKELMKGDSNPNWRGGVSADHLRRRKNEKDDRDDIWSRSVRSRDDYQCVICADSENLEAHHVKPYDDYESLRYEVDNGVTLCRSCHARVHSVMGTMKKDSKSQEYNKIVDYVIDNPEADLSEVARILGTDIIYTGEVISTLKLIGAIKK